MNRGNRYIRWILAAMMMLAMVMALAACSETGYTKEGKVTVLNGKDQACEVQIAEIREKKKKDKTQVYLQGTSDYKIADYKMRKKGYSWKIHIGLEMIDENGNRVEPTEEMPYMMGKSSGNAVSYKFKGKGYTGLYIYHVDNKENGVEVPIDKLEIPEEYQLSKLIKKLE